MSIITRIFEKSEARPGRRKFFKTEKFCNVSSSHGHIVHATGDAGLARCSTPLISIRYTDEKINCVNCRAYRKIDKSQGCTWWSVAKAN